MSVERIQARSADRDLYETREFLASVHKAYLNAFESRDDPWVRVDGTGSRDEVEERIWSAVSALMHRESDGQSA